MKASGVVFAPFSYQNWTATEIDAGNSWTVSSNIATIQESKKYKRDVRCIKDL